MGVIKTVKNKTVKMMKPPSNKTAKLFQYSNCKKHQKRRGNYLNMKN
jgi:hypothetical protein